MAVVSCIAFVLVFHILVWPLRSTFGWRLSVSDNNEGPNSRQFGTGHLFAWVGLVASLLWLLRTAVEVVEVLYAILAIIALVGFTALLVLPWLGVLRVQKVKFWLLCIGLLVIVLLSYLAHEGTIQFNVYQLSNGTAVGPPFLLPPLRFPEYAAYSCGATFGAAFSFLTLHRMGLRFVAPAKRSPS